MEAFLPGGQPRYYLNVATTQPAGARSERRPIQLLDPAVARKIAAGEVVDRPGAVVRELLDNSLDAGATQIDIDLVAGGTELIRVADDGCGMDRADLERCFLAHATSKIVTDDDLLHVRSLGFRGEALASIAEVSRLEITSASPDDTPHQVIIHGGRLVSSAPAAGAPGTSVSAADLFYNVPARRQFQKRAASESAVARAVVLDRALAFPEVSYRLRSDGEVKVFLPPAGLIERIAAAYPHQIEPAMLHEIEAGGEGFRARIVAGEPGFPRKDRKGLQVFVNRRRIWEFALVQAIEYAYRDYLHGGLYPVAYLYLDVEPELVDFNIHPAKREARFRILPDIHRRVVGALSEFLRVFDRRAVGRGEALPFGQADGAGWLQTAVRGASGYGEGTGRGEGSGPGPHDRRVGGGRDGAPDRRDGASGRHETVAQPNVAYDLNRVYRPAPDTGVTFRYLGQIMNLFLVVEHADRLYLVDQHAAHERIIFDRLRAGGSGQELLFPVRLEVEPDQESVLRRNRDGLRRLGIELDERDGAWELVTVPSVVAIEAESLAVLLMDLLDRPADFERELYASLSCRSAVMDGAALAPEDAIGIVDGVMSLKNARCPHGRPIWIEWSRDELFSMVGRT